MVYITDKETNNALLKKEFNLSEKIVTIEQFRIKGEIFRPKGEWDIIATSNIKEFIKKLKESFGFSAGIHHSGHYIQETIDKLSGKDLI